MATRKKINAFCMKKFLQLDWIIIVSFFLLVAIGLMVLYSISSNNNQLDLAHFNRQLLAFAIGLVLMFMIAFYDYRTFNSFSTKFYFLAVLALIIVFFLGIRMRGTTGWIGFLNYNFQPVEMVKLVMIIFLASFLSKKKIEFSNFVKIVVSAILVSIPIFLIIKQPDFGSALIIIGIWIGMLLVSGISKKSMLALGIIFFISTTGGFFLLKDYQKNRLINFVNPQNDPQGSGYNVTQSIVAVGSGGIFGKGLGHGSQSQLNFLPEKHTDFIFAVIAEELGLVGSAFVILLFGIILYRFSQIASLARDNFGYLLSVGVMIMFFIQIFINIGMNIGIAPVTGVPLPFLSYGGSSMVSILASIGVIQSVYVRRVKTLD